VRTPSQTVGPFFSICLTQWLAGPHAFPDGITVGGYVIDGAGDPVPDAMIETWQDSWFEEGSRLIYIVPSRGVDAILPLQVEPAPSQTVRVFVGRIELITPEIQRPVESAIARSDWSTVDRYSRFLSPILNRIYSGNPSKASEIERQFRMLHGSSGADCR